jgi:hypothetical protein
VASADLSLFEQISDGRGEYRKRRQVGLDTLEVKLAQANPADVREHASRGAAHYFKGPSERPLVDLPEATRRDAIHRPDHFRSSRPPCARPHALRLMQEHSDRVTGTVAPPEVSGHSSRPPLQDAERATSAVEVNHDEGLASTSRPRRHWRRRRHATGNTLMKQSIGFRTPIELRSTPRTDRTRPHGHLSGSPPTASLHHPIGARTEKVSPPATKRSTAATLVTSGRT